MLWKQDETHRFPDSELCSERILIYELDKEARESDVGHN